MKPFRETKLGKFLTSKGFNAVATAAGAMIPGVSMLNDVKEMVIGSEEYKRLSPDEQQHFAALHRDAMEELDKRLADLQDARKMYTVKSEMADVVARRVMNWNLPVVALLVGALIYCTVSLSNNVLLALVSSSIGSVTTLLLSERQSIINFFFGSSSGSKKSGEVIGEIAKNLNK